VLSQLPTEVPQKRPDPVVAFESRLLPVLVRLREQPWVHAAMTAPEPPAAVFRAAGPGELWVPLSVTGRPILLLFRWAPGGPEREALISLAADAARAIAAQVNAEQRAVQASTRAARAERRWAKDHTELEAARAENERVRGREAEVRSRLRHVEELGTGHSPMRAVAGLLAGLAHDIRSPLTSVLCNVQTAEELAGQSAELVPVLADARLGCERIEGIVSSVRLLTDVGPSAGRIDVTECVQAAVRFLRYRASRAAISIEASVEAGLSAQGHPTDACQVLYQVLENAIDASPRGSTVVIRARRCEGSTRIEVRDAGPGVMPADRDHVFTPFRTRKSGALGSSLAAARSLARRHGGELSLGEPAPGTGGAVFELRLPGA
jgi:signal transduction histidine kinase